MELIQKLVLRQRLEGPGQQSVRPGKEKAVVQYRDSQPLEGGKSGQHRLPGQHARGTMDNQVVPGEIDPFR